MKFDAILLFYISSVLFSIVTGIAECRSANTEVTDVRVERTIYEWKIKNFHHLLQQETGSISSQSFYSANGTEKWRLQLVLHDNEDSDYISIFLFRDSPEKLPMRVDYELIMMKSDKILVNVSYWNNFKSQDHWGVVNAIERSELPAADGSNDNDITIRCIIYSPFKAITSSYDPTIFDSQATTLLEDFRALYQEPEMSDFTIMVGDKEFRTHKLVLATRSPVFAAMFERNDTEHDQKTNLKIENVEPAVVGAMLEFIYTDQVADIEDLVTELLALADRYELEGLKAKCSKTLFDRLTIENATDILILADRFHADALRKCAIQYIVEHDREVVKSKSFKMAELSSELLRELINKFVQ